MVDAKRVPDREGPPDHGEERDTNAGSGAFRVLRGSVNPAYRDTVPPVSGVIRDSTEARLQFALSAGRMVAWELDFATQAAKFSDNADEVLGFLPGERPATLDFTNFHPDDRDALAEALAQSLESTDAMDAELRWIRPSDGRLIWLEGRGRLILDRDGVPVQFHGVLIDITERKRNEVLRARASELELENHRIEEVSRAKSLFLQSMSHELRTPLNAIIGFTQLLYDGEVEPDSPEQREFLGDILSSGQRLLRLIEDLLELAEIDAQTGEPRSR